MIKTSNTKKCAYCGSQGPFTHEHLFTDGLAKRTPPPEYNVQYLEKAQKFIEGDLTIRDVCAKCNNESLSLLDAYICELYDEYFNHFVRTGESIRFRYRFDELARWLLKIIYNSARVHNSDPGVLSKCTQYILWGHKKPMGLTLLLQLVIPHKIDPANASLLPESVQEAGEIVPYMMRIAKPYNPQLVPYTKVIAISRIVALNSYYFWVFIPEQEQYSRPAWRSTLKKLQHDLIPDSHRLISARNEMFVPASNTDFVDVFGPSILANWDFYQPHLQ